MFKFQNLSPRKLSLFASILLSIPVGLAFIWLGKNFTDGIIAFVINMALSYLLISYVLDTFIYRKIKLIYKFIYNTKANKKEEMYNKYLLPKKGIDEVRSDVEKWAFQKREEIAVLKSNENYRKEFLQNLSHEFKTPIFSIQGYVETLLDGAMHEPDITEKFLTNTHKNIKRIVELIKDLDEITELESGEKPLVKERFYIQDLIKEIFDSLSMDIANNGMHCSLKKGAEVPVMVYADREKIGQVLTNLVQNAIKYKKYEGKIVVSVYKTEEKKILIEVSDDGIGITEESLPRIFERFYRTDAGRGRNSGGSGLGLSICKHIIEAHGETIHARSKPDIGTTIGFTLSEFSR
ncbi:MAG: HAMP domain-containing histidine kinase [Bacteroidetes bacterium]|nr:HAMP domain-containing histidine kinase [Bacteroidota bacterium]